MEGEVLWAVASSPAHGCFLAPTANWFGSERSKVLTMLKMFMLLFWARIEVLTTAKM
jgi:hypothetical protein